MMSAWSVKPSEEATNPVIRMQIINGICRALGEKNHFYQLSSRHGINRSSMIETMMRRIVRLLRRAQGVGQDERETLVALAKTLAEAMAEDDYDAMVRGTEALATTVKALPTAGPIVTSGAEALLRYATQAGPALAEEATVFVVVVLTSAARHLGRDLPA